MRQVDLVSLGSVVDHQQPAGQPFLDLGMAIDQRRPRRLDKEGVGIGKQRRAKRLALCHLRLKILNRQAPAIACDLDVGLIGRAVLAENDGNACHAIKANDPDFTLPPSSHGGDHRSDTRFWKIHMLDRLIRDLQLGFEVELDMMH